MPLPRKPEPQNNSPISNLATTGMAYALFGLLCAGDSLLTLLIGPAQEPEEDPSQDRPRKGHRSDTWFNPD